GLWAFVEGSATGIHMSELSPQNPARVDDPPAKGPQPPPPNPFYRAPSLPAGSVEERTNLDEGPVVVQWPNTLSPESFEELEYFFKGLIRRARRKAGLPLERT